MLAPVLLSLTAALGPDVEEAKIVYAVDYKAAFEEAKIRNVPVLILDFDGWSTAMGHEIDHILDDKKFQAMARDCTCTFECANMCSGLFQPTTWTKYL